MENKTPRILKIFYCYARKDKLLREELDLHLSALKRQSHVTTWADHEIAPGTDWEKSIDTHLTSADIIFLLISPDFMGSDYCYSIEMQQALERHHTGKARVIPIILRPVDWEDTPFRKLQALPTDARPVTTWPNQDEAFADIVKNLRPIIKNLRNQLKTKDDWLAEATDFLAQEHHKEALAALNQALILDPNFAPALSMRGKAYRLLDNYEKALADLDHALSLEPNDASILARRGETYRLLGNYKKALADFDHALSLNPNDTLALARRGETYRIVGNYEKALADLDCALALEPESSFALKSRGDTHRFLENYKQALADFDHALSLNPTSTDALASRGTTYREMKDYKQALADFDHALSLNPTSADVLARRGNTYREMKDYKQALADLNAALFHDPDDAWALAIRGETYQLKGELNKSIADFDRAIALNEQDWYIYKRAITYFLLGQKRNCDKDLTKAIELAQAGLRNLSSITERWEVTFNIALYYLFLGKSETAQALYEILVSVCTLRVRLQNAETDLMDLRKLLPENELITTIHEQIFKRLTEIE